MIWGRHINKYYLKHGPMLLLGLFALIMVDYFQLEIPRLYKYVINGMNDGAVEIDGVRHVFNMDFVLEKICIPLVMVQPKSDILLISYPSLYENKFTQHSLS